MSCGCKNGTSGSINEVPDEVQKEISNLTKVRRYTFRGITFLFALVLLPLLLPVVIWMLFKTIVLTEQINMMPLLLHVGKKIKNISTPKEEYDSIDELNPDDYELVGVNNTKK